MFLTEDSTLLRAKGIATVAAAQDSRCFDTQDKNDTTEAKTSDAKIQDMLQALGQMAATIITSRDMVPTSPQEPLHQLSLPQLTLPHNHFKEQASTPRYPCEPSQLFENMVSTIQKAQVKLEDSGVPERGYLLLQLESTPLGEAFANFWGGCENASEDKKAVQKFVL